MPFNDHEQSILDKLEREFEGQGELNPILYAAKDVRVQDHLLSTACEEEPNIDIYTLSAMIASEYLLEAEQIEEVMRIGHLVFERDVLHG